MGIDNPIRSLVETYYDQVVKTAKQFGASPSDAEDVAQKVFILASRKLDVIAVGSEWSFLYGVTIRVVGDLRRSAVVRREVVHEEIDVSQTGPALDSIVDEYHAHAVLD
ncbi:MAG: sigma factor [Polyangiaceae bacterium]